MKRDVFQAIADPTRRAILLLVATQAMTPNAVADHFSSTRQAVSKHIKILRESQLLKQEKKWAEKFSIIYTRKGFRKLISDLNASKDFSKNVLTSWTKY